MLVDVTEIHQEVENAKFSHPDKSFDQIIPVPYRAQLKERLEVGQMLLIKGSTAKESVR